TDIDIPLDSDTLPDPAPAVYSGSLAALDGYSPNGTWRLYARDGAALLPVSIGSIAGWSLQVTTWSGLADASPASKDFGAVTVGKSSTTQRFTIANIGDAALSLAAG